MKYILVSVGTRGDMEPFLAVAQMLQKKGHQCICAFPEQFKNLAEDSGIKFYGLSPKFLELVEGEDAVNVMGGKISPFKKIQLLVKLYKMGVVVNKEMVQQQYLLFEAEKPDRVIFNGKSTFPIIWEVLNPGRAFLLSPVPCLIHAVKAFPHVGFKGNYGNFINKLTYNLANFGLIKNVQSTSKEIRNKLNISSNQIKKTLFKVNTLYSISPTLFQRPAYWPENAKVVGYHERDKTLNWEPGEELLHFLANHKKVLFITFGSMTNPEPEAKTKLILDILEKNKIPAIINSASGGLIKPEKYNSQLIHFEQTIPYDWLFPKVHGVIHHGGSGTTHAAIKYGCATMIIPHIIDQFHWNNFLFDLGVGPKGIAIDKITTKKLEPKIMEIFRNENFKEKAEKLSEQLKQENHEKMLYDILTN